MRHQLVEIGRLPRLHVVRRAGVEDPRGERETRRLAICAAATRSQLHQSPFLVPANHSSPLPPSNPPPSLLATLPLLPSLSPNQKRKKNSLRKLQLHALTPRRALEQIPIVGRLLHHARVQRVARHPPLLEGAVAANEARQPRLRGSRGGVVAAAGELVQREGEGEGGEGDVEAALWGRGGEVSWG